MKKIQNRIYIEKEINGQIRAQLVVMRNQRDASFRKKILEKYPNVCILTGSRIVSILEACHIWDASEAINDTEDNGLLLRRDVHRLYDIRKIRIDCLGTIILSRDIKSEYNWLPKKVNLPSGINLEYVSWKFENLVHGDIDTPIGVHYQH